MRRTVHSLLASEIVEHGMGNLVEIQNYSSLIRLINVLTYVMKIFLHVAEEDESYYI